MGLPLKIPVTPLIVALALLIWICSDLLYCTAFIFGFTETLVAVLSITMLVTHSAQDGVALLVVASLVSPMGLPMATAWLLGKLQTPRYTIQDWIYG